jgi:hypothetical protein
MATPATSKDPSSNMTKAANATKPMRSPGVRTRPKTPSRPGRDPLELFVECDSVFDPDCPVPDAVYKDICGVCDSDRYESQPSFCEPEPEVRSTSSSPSRSLSTFQCMLDVNTWLERGAIKHPYTAKNIIGTAHGCAPWLLWRVSPDVARAGGPALATELYCHCCVEVARLCGMLESPTWQAVFGALLRARNYHERFQWMIMFINAAATPDRWGLSESRARDAVNCFMGLNVV